MPVRIARRLFAPLAHAREEVIAFAFFDRDGALLGVRYAPGERDRARVPIRAVAADAIAFDAAVVVMAHNHPSGDSRPSADDLAVTRRLAQGLEALGVRLHDHLIFAGPATTSLRDAGIL